ncbi:MAG: HAMP domain-containing histidine kinase [Deltaproteobacteria bacterium]|nr:HAMP domain-containing histidine kinase [Deltaproteobacteria bacterium]
MVEPGTARGSVQEELDRRLFYLKTLYDMSCELFGIMEVKEILKHFLLMTTGNFGVIEGFVLLMEPSSGKIEHFTSVGIAQDSKTLLKTYAADMLRVGQRHAVILDPDHFPESGVFHGLFALLVPFQVDGTCEGILGIGQKLVGEPYSREDKDLLLTLVNSLVIALKNARYAEALKEAYEEVSSLNRAKDKVINHLSHELKTPLSLLKASLTVLERRLTAYPEGNWGKTLLRAQKNVDRLMAMQEEVDDIMRGKDVTVYRTLNLLLDQCADQLALLAADELGHDKVIERVRDRIESLFGPRDQPPEKITLDGFVAEQLEALIPLFSHRKVRVQTDLAPVPPLIIPPDVLTKTVNGLVRNAVENTPDGGTIDLVVKGTGEEVHFIIHDHGVGITKEHQKRIFEGFFPTQETDAYCTGHPFDFNAGGKGADLLRMKIFSERFNFRIQMESERCRHIPGENDVCPGSVEQCVHCATEADCADCGGTVFKVIFPASEVEKP